MPYISKEKQKEYAARHYQKYRAKYRESSAKTREARRKFLQEEKSKPCIDCNNSYPYYVMQFDHVRGDKEFNIGRNHGNRSMTKLKEEINKCDVVCANCHAIRTWNRLQ